jgi:hypothetical protein
MGFHSAGHPCRYPRMASFLLLSFILMATLGAGSLKGGKEEMEITGKIAVIGNEPFTQVSIRSEDGQVYALVGKHDQELRRLQGRRVAITGKPSEEKPRGTQAIEVKSFRVLEDK